MPSLTFLGTGPGSAVPGRGQASILLQTSEAKILLDAGEPCSGRLLDLGVSFSELDEIWITHAHPDHVGGLPMLLQASSAHGRKEALSLGLPAHLIEPLNQWLGAILLPQEIAAFPRELFPWSAGQSRDLGNISVTPWPNTHLDEARNKTGQKDIESFLFDIRTEGKRLIYTGDIGAASDLRDVLREPADVLVCELAHVTLESLIEVLTPVRIGMLCLTHRGRHIDESSGEVKDELVQKLPQIDAIYLPDDGERLEF